MASAVDGIDPATPSKSDPPKAPTFRIVLENEYAWGPPWYAPTWGVVYFLWNYQDPADGRFVYRDAFREFINTSGGSVGKGAIKNVRGGRPRAPAAADEGRRRGEGQHAATCRRPSTSSTRSGRTWLIELRDEQIGTIKADRPYLAWARHALTRKDFDDATEHFEKGLERNPTTSTSSSSSRSTLVDRSRNTDRASKLAPSRAARPRGAPRRRTRSASRRSRPGFEKWDAKRSHARADAQGAVGRRRRTIAERYAEPAPADDDARDAQASAATSASRGSTRSTRRRCGRRARRWRSGSWPTTSATSPAGPPDPGRSSSPTARSCASRFGAVRPERLRGLLPDLRRASRRATSPSRRRCTPRRARTRFCGLVFGRKGATSFHALVYFPEGYGRPRLVRTARGAPQDVAPQPGARRHRPVAPPARGRRRARRVDVWIDGASSSRARTSATRTSCAAGSASSRASGRRVPQRALPVAVENDVGAQIERKVRLEALHLDGEAGQRELMDRARAAVPARRDVVPGQRDGVGGEGLRPDAARPLVAAGRTTRSRSTGGSPSSRSGGPTRASRS